MISASKPESLRNEPRSTSVSQSEKPEIERSKRKRRKTRKSERRLKQKLKAKKKAEDKRKKKEAEDFRKQLQSESEVLHGYLFDEAYRCNTQESQMTQAKHEKKLGVFHFGKDAELQI